MGDMKQHQLPLTIEEQIENLKSIGFFGVLICIKQILKNDIHWNDFVENIELLFKRYKKVEFKTMGFPENWRELVEIKN